MLAWLMPFPLRNPHSSSVAIVNATQYLQAVRCGKTALKMTLIFYIIVIIYMIGRSNASQIELLPCPDSSPPCTHNQVLTQDLCHGENGYATIKIEIPIHQIPLITTADITIYKESDPIIVGLTKNPNFQCKDRWKASQMISDVTDKSGILTLILHVDDAQPEDEFLSHIEIRLRDQTISTSDEIWFHVNADCSASSTHQEYYPRGTIMPDELNASIQHPHRRAEDIKLELKEVIDELKSDTTFICDMKYIMAGIDTSLSENRILIIIVMLMLICIMAVWIVQELRMCFVKYKKKKLAFKTESRNKDIESSKFEREMLLLTGNLNKLGNEVFQTQICLMRRGEKVMPLEIWEEMEA